VTDETPHTDAETLSAYADGERLLQTDNSWHFTLADQSRRDSDQPENALIPSLIDQNL
jgi:hypothetical protein